jgi:hypothetical protein
VSNNCLLSLDFQSLRPLVSPGPGSMSFSSSPSFPVMGSDGPHAALSRSPEESTVVVTEPVIASVDAASLDVSSWVSLEAFDWFTGSVGLP